MPLRVSAPTSPQHATGSASAREHRRTLAFIRSSIARPITRIAAVRNGVLSGLGMPPRSRITPSHPHCEPLIAARPAMTGCKISLAVPKVPTILISHRPQKFLFARTQSGGPRHARSERPGWRPNWFPTIYLQLTGGSLHHDGLGKPLRDPRVLRASSVLIKIEPHRTIVARVPASPQTRPSIGTSRAQPARSLVAAPGRAACIRLICLNLRKTFFTRRPQHDQYEDSPSDPPLRRGKRPTQTHADDADKRGYRVPARSFAASSDPQKSRQPRHRVPGPAAAVTRVTIMYRPAPCIACSCTAQRVYPPEHPHHRPSPRSPSPRTPTPRAPRPAAPPRAPPISPPATPRTRQAATASSRTHPASAPDRTAPAPCAPPASGSSGTGQCPSHRHVSGATTPATA